MEAPGAREKDKGSHKKENKWKSNPSPSRPLPKPLEVWSFGVGAR
jgi:hypothetical protein